MATSDYLQGDGSASSPYVIHNLAAALQFFNADIFIAGVYASLAVDLDLTGYTFSSNTVTYATLNGNGRQIKGLRHFQHNYQSSIFLNIKFIDIYYLNASGQQNMAGQTRNLIFINCIFLGGTLAVSNGVLILTKCVLSAILWKYVYTSRSIFTDSYLLPPAGTNYKNPGNLLIDLSSSATPYLASNYSNFLSEDWVVDGIAIPRLYKKDITGLVTAYVVKGITKVGGQLKSRRCSAHYPIDFYQISAVMSQSSDGSYLLNCGAYADHVYVTHRDDYGVQIKPDSNYYSGNLVHPKTPTGYRYRCSTPGTTPSVVPDELPVSGSISLGTAIFTPEPIYQAETFLVVPRLYNLLTGQPV